MGADADEAGDSSLAPIRWRVVFVSVLHDMPICVGGGRLGMGFVGFACRLVPRLPIVL